MFACNCAAVTESEVRESIARDAITSLDELRDTLGVASCCGCCTSEVEALLATTDAACAA